MRAFTITAAGVVKSATCRGPIGAGGGDRQGGTRGESAAPTTASTTGSSTRGFRSSMGTSFRAWSAMSARTSWLAPGDRVAVDPTLYCGHCLSCLRRQSNHCDHWGDR